MYKIINKLIPKSTSKQTTTTHKFNQYDLIKIIKKDLNNKKKLSLSFGGVIYFCSCYWSFNYFIIS